METLPGEIGVVIKEITPHNTGQVKVHGQIWTAISDIGGTLEEGISVRVIRVEGVKLVVMPLEESETEV